MNYLDQNVAQINGVGEKIAAKMERLGIKSIRDLLYYFPRAWQDLTCQQSIRSLRIGEEAIIKAKIVNLNQIRTHRKWMSLVEAILEDNSGQIKAIWFNQPFLMNVLSPGQEWIFAGKVNFDFKNKIKTLTPSLYELESKILPIYSETEGLTSKFLRKIIEPRLKHTSEFLSDFLPENYREKLGLIPHNEALENIHFPENNELLEKAKKRLAFDELFLIALKMSSARAELEKESSLPMAVNEKMLKDFASSLPFKLTNAQRKVAWEIIQDLAKKTPMNRLLEGDVGSGKTVVAAMAALVAAKSGFKTVWLAPTEILANQHFKNVSRLLEKFKLKIGLVTASSHLLNQESGIKNHGMGKRIHDSSYIIHNSDILIGTHALIQKDVVVPNLGLIIVDEQHRFGVKQRAHLRQGYGGEVHFIPHLLSMTATPIPRTLALALYGDLDLSVIDQMPEGRQKIVTRVVEPKNRVKAYEFIAGQIKSGRQVFVICPLIESKETLKINLFETDRKSAIEEYEKLSKKVFPQFRIGLLHGKMKAKEKDEIMEKFTAGQMDILVSTAVVEVGIDVPNATVMMIESAERFGLAQLHQFRGRVGRGQHQSYCFLFSESQSLKAIERLNAMSRSENGFELAEFDLKTRGPGELAGIRQSGIADLKMATLTDTILVGQARQTAEEIVKTGLDQYPLLKEKMEEFESNRHLE